MIVACAACGKQFKGSPGVRKLKCSACANLFTFPAAAKLPSPGQVLCSCCWTETKAQPELRNCPVCQQRMTPRYGGLASEDPAVFQRPPKPTGERAGDAAGGARRTPTVQVAVLRECDAAVARAEQAEARLDVYRQVALDVLEPLVDEFSQAFEALRGEAEQLAELARQARAQLHSSDSAERAQGLVALQGLETRAAELRHQLEAVRRNLGERFSRVLHGGESPSPRENP